jgi:hypothetical protein
VRQAQAFSKVLCVLSPERITQDLLEAVECGSIRALIFKTSRSINTPKQILSEDIYVEV